MTERVSRLREQSLNAVPCISHERAMLVTEFYRNAGSHSAPMRRALAFKVIMETKTICINEGELIVGERGPSPKATPTYPELCCHSLADLDILNSRGKVSFEVSDDTRRLYQDTVIPYWRGKTIREKIFEEMTDEWKAAYASGIFTEFMEQRAPGHTVLDDKIYRKGMLDFKNDITRSLNALDHLNDPEAYDKQKELKAVSVCADVIIGFAHRHAEKLHEQALGEQDAQRRGELEQMEQICRYVPAHAPRTFWEALQYYWFVHLGVITELNPWDAFNPGRLDQHLYRFYKREIDEGTLTREKAKELLECLWVKFNNHPAPPKVGVTAEESSTFTDFANINTGGLKADGSDGVNELSYLVLEVVDEMRLVQPSSNIQLSQRSSDEFLKTACRIVRKGWGQPSMFNADMVVEELLRQGKSIEDARSGGTSGCVETGAFGKESYILTGYLNLPKILEITLHNGIDHRTGKKIGVETGHAEDLSSFDELMGALRHQLKNFIDIKVRGNNVIERLYAEYMPTPFLSILISDCIAKGKDYQNGGARYNTNYIQGVGLGTVTDSLSAIKCHVFEDRNLKFAELCQILDADFEGHEAKRMMLLNRTPRYGNDDDYADNIMRSVFEILLERGGRTHEYKGRSLSNQHAADDLPHLFRFCHGGNSRWEKGMDAALRRNLARAGSRSSRTNCCVELSGEDGPCAHRRDASESEIHSTSAGRGKRY